MRPQVQPLNVLVAPAKNASPLDTAAAYVNLSEVAYSAGDLFEAQQYVDSAVRELQARGFPDPLAVGLSVPFLRGLKHRPVC